MEENELTNPVPATRKFLGVPFTRTNLIIFGAAVILGIGGAIAAFSFVRDLVKSWTLTDIPGAPVYTPGANQPASDEAPLGQLPVDEVATESFTMPEMEAAPLIDPWDGASRVNVLFMGLDYRDWEAGADASRTDTMILLTIDPKTKTAGMLSIPRDLWVHIPGFTHGKINTAYYLGEVWDYPGGGPALAMETVEHFLGVPIQYYVQIDFITFIHLIDEINGITITVNETLKIYPLDYPDFTSFTSKVLEPGTYTIPGNYALAYARARNSEGGDFDRAARQQELILAVRNRILKFDMVPTLLKNADEIYARLSEGIHTNLTLQQALQLGMLGLELKQRDIKSGIISPEMLYAGKSPDGLDILIAIPDEIRLLRDEIFNNNAGAIAMADTTKSNYELALEEEPTIGIYNGTYEEGLASETAEFFADQGFNIVETGNAGDIYTYTTVYLYAGSPKAAAYLSELMNIQPGRYRVRYDPDATVDIVIMLGSDWALSNPMP